MWVFFLRTSVMKSCLSKSLHFLLDSSLVSVYWWFLNMFLQTSMILCALSVILLLVRMLVFDISYVILIRRKAAINNSIFLGCLMINMLFILGNIYFFPLFFFFSLLYQWAFYFLLLCRNSSSNYSKEHRYDPIQTLSNLFFFHQTCSANLLEEVKINSCLVFVQIQSFT